MPMLPMNGNYLKAENLKNGDTLVFNDAGDWVESTKYTYPNFQKDGVTPHPMAGRPKKDLVFNVTVGGAKYMFRMNATNQNLCKDKWGRNTDDWKGKMCKVDVCKVMAAGKMMDSIILTPIGEAEGHEPDEINWNE